ncbi:MAG: hypothetical protein L0209_11170, partial [candidate division Zixibacteria bacterium]|nr:hypothetical protein [candidate division Zixibacteria bacterium]
NEHFVSHHDHADAYWYELRPGQRGGGGPGAPPDEVPGPADVPLILSNHDDARPIAEQFGVAYHHLPVDPARRAEQERVAMDLIFRILIYQMP